MDEKNKTQVFQLDIVWDMLSAEVAKGNRLIREMMRAINVLRTAKNGPAKYAFDILAEALAEEGFHPGADEPPERVYPQFLFTCPACKKNGLAMATQLPTHATCPHCRTELYLVKGGD